MLLVVILGLLFGEDIYGIVFGLLMRLVFLLVTGFVVGLLIGGVAEFGAGASSARLTAMISTVEVVRTQAITTTIVTTATSLVCHPSYPDVCIPPSPP